MKVLRIPDIGQLPFWKSLYIYCSVKNHPISMTFGTRQQILNLMTVTWPKTKIF